MVYNHFWLSVRSLDHMIFFTAISGAVLPRPVVPLQVEGSFNQLHCHLGGCSPETSDAPSDRCVRRVLQSHLGGCSPETASQPEPATSRYPGSTAISGAVRPRQKKQHALEVVLQGSTAISGAVRPRPVWIDDSPDATLGSTAISGSVRPRLPALFALDLIVAELHCHLGGCSPETLICPHRRT